MHHVRANVMQEPPLATEFLEVPCEVKTAEIEKIGGACFCNTRSASTALESLEPWTCCPLVPDDNVIMSASTLCSGRPQQPEVGQDAAGLRQPGAVDRAPGVLHLAGPPICG